MPLRGFVRCVLTGPRPWHCARSFTYLVLPDRQTWLNCATGGFTYGAWEGGGRRGCEVRSGLLGAVGSSCATQLARALAAADVCPYIFPNSGIDFPRTINIYVIGEQGPTDWVGYAFAPGATDDVTYGHIGLTWTTVSPGEGAWGGAAERRQPGVCWAWCCPVQMGRAVVVAD